MSDLEQIRLAVRRFTEEREWQPFHTPKNLAMALAGSPAPAASNRDAPERPTFFPRVCMLISALYAERATTRAPLPCAMVAIADFKGPVPPADGQGQMGVP